MVELVRAERSPEQLAKEFEPSANAIRNWAQQANRDKGHRSDGLTTPEREELRQLRSELLSAIGACNGWRHESGTPARHQDLEHRKVSE